MIRRSVFTPLLVCLSAPVLCGQQGHEGAGQGYDGELTHVSSQLIVLADGTPADKFAFRPAPGVRSIGEVYMHIVFANFYLLSQTGVGPKMPTDLKPDMMKTVPAKAELIDCLKKSLEVGPCIRQAR